MDDISEQDELADLLDELDKEEIQPEPANPVEAAQDSQAIVPVQTETVPAEIIQPQVVEQTPDNFNLLGVIKQFDGDYGEIKKNLASDRANLGKVIAKLIGRLETNAIEPEELESLVKALEVQADTNGHAVKLLDSRSKLLSAAKSGLQIFMQQNSGANDTSDLQKILAQPKQEDEDV